MASFSSGSFSGAVGGFSTDGAAAVIAQHPGAAAWGKVKKKKRKEPVIHFSDLEGREAYAQQLAQASIPIVHHKHDVPVPAGVIDEEEDDILAVLLMKVLH